MTDIFKVYCADHTYSTLRLPMDATVAEIIAAARDKLCLGDDPRLCEVKSNGGQYWTHFFFPILTCYVSDKDTQM